MSKQILVFVDDIRMPEECTTYMHLRIGKNNPIYLEEWEIARNYKEFVDMIKKHAGNISHISFDHDLADEHYSYERGDSLSWEEYHMLQDREMTGYDCAKWFKEYYEENNLPLCTLYVHSINPVGTQNIINLFKK